MTDGLSANTISTSARATDLHNDGVEVYAIGIGNAASSTNTELSDIASDPDSYYLHQVNLFQYLCSIVPEIVPKLDNDTLALSIFRCPTPATTTTPVMTFLNKSRSADSSGDTSSSSSSDSTTIAAAASVAAVGTVGAAVGAAVGVAKYLSMLKAQAPNPFVQSIVAQYKNAPLGQGKAKFSHKFKASGGIPAMPAITSKPPVITAWR
ncbi:hypothetical protein FSP39_011628 [Pinctada imbricata]|uniref:VWFA domain-containing protein n=1 Tax=Pinctada imbricata TaxID=66713 RepID=A0AA88Y7H4_PINIB|nr:hypothetical protein FSP39_011628 [Pinctada imbricata]